MGQGDSARDFGTSESMKNAGILDVFPIFHAARLGAKDPPKPAAPIVRCCLRQARVTERHPKEHNNKALTTGFWKKLSKGIFVLHFYDMIWLFSEFCPILRLNMAV